MRKPRGRAHAHADLETPGTEQSDAATRDLRIGIDEADDDARHTGVHDRLGARTSAAVMRARFEGAVKGGPACQLARGAQCTDLGVGSAGRARRALEHVALGGHHDRADPRVRWCEQSHR